MELSINNQDTPYNKKNVFMLKTNSFTSGFLVINIKSQQWTTSFGGYAKFRVEFLKDGKRVKNVPTTIAIIDLDQMQQETKNRTENSWVRANMTGMNMTEFARIEGFKPNKWNTYITDPDPDVAITPDGTFTGLKNDTSTPGWNVENNPVWKKKAIFIKENIFKNGYADITYGAVSPGTGNELNITVGELYVKYKIDNNSAGTLSRNQQFVQFNNNPNINYNLNENYKAKYWTCDQDVKIGYKSIPAGSPISLSEINKVSVQNFYTFTLHTEKNLGGIKIIKIPSF